MRKNIIIMSVIGMSLVAFAISNKKIMDMPRVETTEDIVRLFDCDGNKLQERLAYALQKAQQQLDTLIAIPGSERTFDNTIRAFDTINADLHPIATLAYMLTMVSTDEEFAQRHRKRYLKLMNFLLNIYPKILQYIKQSKRIMPVIFYKNS